MNRPLIADFSDFVFPMRYFSLSVQGNVNSAKSFWMHSRKKLFQLPNRSVRRGPEFSADTSRKQLSVRPASSTGD